MQDVKPYIQAAQGPLSRINTNSNIHNKNNYSQNSLIKMLKKITKALRTARKREKTKAKNKN